MAEEIKKQAEKDYKKSEKEAKKAETVIVTAANSISEIDASNATSITLDVNDIDTNFPTPLKVTTSNTEITFPTGTTISDGNPTNIEIKVSTKKATDLPEGAIPGVIIELGSETEDITFDTSIRILLPGQAGQTPFIISSSTDVTTIITTLCPEDTVESADNVNPTTADACHIDVGGDKVLWSRHFSGVGTFSNGGGGGTGVDGQAPTLGKNRFGAQLVENGFTFNGKSVDVGRWHTDYPTITTEVGKLNTIAVKVYENGGIEHINRVEFALGVPEVGKYWDYEALIEVWMQKGGEEIKEIKIFDELNIIEDESVNVFISQVECNSDGNSECLQVSLDYMYREAPKYNVIAIKPSDFRGYASQFFFNDGVEVIGESLNPPATMRITTDHAQYHPQRSGFLELTQIDRYQNIWEDEYGIQWNIDGNRIKQITLPDYEKPMDDDYIGMNGMKRDHPLFEQYKYEQHLKAMELIKDISW